jgi:hypothetical protein
VNTHRGVKFFIPLNIELFDFSLKAEVWRNGAKGAKHRGMAAPLAVRVPQTKRKRQGAELRAKVIITELRALLVILVTGEGP